jgi:hypothetical protein
MQTQSTCYKGTSKMTVKGVLWHSTGANNPNLKRYVQPSDVKPASDTYTKAEWLKILGTNNNKNDMNHIKREMGMNGWIGKLADGSVAAIQLMPWDYKPWGCGSGPKGSCNNGWIQFEICEDGLTDKTYFNAIYKEACELTAYLCLTYKIDPKGTTIVNGVKVPNILCHADSNKLGLGSNHGDIYHWFKKHGKDMDDVRNDVAKLIADAQKPAAAPAKPAQKEEPKAEAQYFVRKEWSNPRTQIGAYANLDNAKKARDQAGNDYEVYSKTGALVYPSYEEESKEFSVGEKVTIVPGAKWSTGAAVPTWLLSKQLYIREIYKNGILVLSTVQTGPYTGTIKPQYVKKVGLNNSTNKPASNFKSYLVIVTANSLNVRNGAGTQYKVNTTIKKGQVYTIIDEKNGWGKLKSGAGWIDLSYTKKL